MTVGEKPFRIDSNGVLELHFKPALPAWLFTKETKIENLKTVNGWQNVEFAANTFSFMFLGKILVSFHNPKMLDTFGKDGVTTGTITVTDFEGKRHIFNEGFISGEIANKVRDRKVSRIDIELR